MPDQRSSKWRCLVYGAYSNRAGYAMQRLWRGLGMIGPKCNNCGRQRRHHKPGNLACPTGKKYRNIGFASFSEKARFEAKEKSTGGASESRKDRKVRRTVKSNPCAACGTKGTDWNPVDPAHIRTFNVTQSDHPSAMIPLCRNCHRMQGAEGWGYFIGCFPHIADLLDSMGWIITPDPFSRTRVVLFHPEVA